MLYDTLAIHFIVVRNVLPVLVFYVPCLSKLTYFHCYERWYVPKVELTPHHKYTLASLVMITHQRSYNEPNSNCFIQKNGTSGKRSNKMKKKIFVL